MPDPTTSDLPSPKSWEEFEDLIWDLYKLIWKDPKAQRHGRSGQAQQGVDIYGCPQSLGGQYAGIQCKRSKDGALTEQKLLQEIENAESFQPPLAEFIIATTEQRDAPLQKAIRLIDERRRSVGKFPVQIVFWEDICAELVKPQHQDVFITHYRGWREVFMSATSSPPLVRDVPRESFQLGDNSAAGFPYQTAPLQDAFSRATDTLRRASTGESEKIGILILGESNVGKTRLAIEALHTTLPDWHLLRWNPDMEDTDILLPSAVRTRGVVMFIDDLQDYAPAPGQRESGLHDAPNFRTVRLRAAIESLRGTVARCVVVATCRQEDEAKVLAAVPWLTMVLAPIPLTRFNTDENDPRSREVIELFKEHGSVETGEWDGTIGSLVLGLVRKRSQYLALGGTLPAITLRAMTLLRFAGITLLTEARIRATCAQVFGCAEILNDLASWREVEDELIRLQFVSLQRSDGELALLIRKDVYFTHVITDYPGAQASTRLLQDFDQLETMFEGMGDYLALIDVSRMLRHFGVRERALLCIRRACAIQPTNIEALFEHAALLCELGRYNDMLDVTTKMTTLDPRERRCWRLHVIALEALHESDEALAASDRAIGLAADDASKWNSRAQFLAGRGLVDESLEAISRAIALEPSAAYHHSTRGVILAQIGRMDEAFAENRLAVDLEPSDAHGWSNLADTLLHLHRLEEAMEASERAEGLESTSWWLWAVRARILLAMKDFEGAVQAGDKALAKLPAEATLPWDKPAVAQTWYESATALQELKLYEKAAEAGAQAVALNESNAQYWAAYGQILSHLERWQGAYAAQEQALIRDPLRAVTWANAAYTLIRLGRFDEAIRTAEMALSLQSDLPYAWYVKGEALFDLREYREALAALDQCIEQTPDYSHALHLKGWILFVLCEFQSAVEVLTQASIQNPDSAKVWADLAVAQIGCGQFEQALDATERELALDPNNPLVYNKKATALGHYLNRWQDALAVINQGLEISPDDAGCWDVKADILRALGRTGEADEAATRAQSLTKGKT
jgi:tetratricopeptide (TPR) repeat protein